ncbi:mitochondrial carrier [Clavulina sp. PMI_390]|nr:mitochondrial carrier [Clavulina sp. PMI_390]
MSGSSSIIHATSGAAAGVVAMTLTYPLIFLSTRAAVQVKNSNKSTYEAITDIIKSEGITGLYSGLNSSLLGIAVTNGFYYYFYEGTKEAFIARRPKGASHALTTLESMLAGSIAGSATSILVNPIWVVQTTQATQTMTVNDPSSSTSKPVKTKKMGLIETVRFILKQNGVGGLWRGIGPALVLVLNPIIQYTVFEQLKNLLIVRRTATLRAASPGSKAIAILSDMDFFWLGALSKLIATSSTYPYIVIKSRLQAGHASAAKYKNSLDGLATVIKEEGIAGLYKGIGSKLVQSVLTAAILFAGQKRIYELTRAAMTAVPAVKA